MIATPLSLHPNGSIALLPSSDRRHLESVALSCGQIIQRMYASIEHVYFPTSGAVSLVRTTAAGEHLEIATVGSEGMFGWPLAPDIDTSPYNAIVLVPGEAYRIPLAAMRDEVELSPTWRSFTAVQQAALLETLFVTAACNGLHSVLQRCCRWLLTAQDYLRADALPFTHELMAQRLGVRRPSISETVALLQNLQIIRSTRGKISILDRAGLEARACDCYRLLQRNRQRRADASDDLSSFPPRPNSI